MLFFNVKIQDCSNRWVPESLSGTGNMMRSCVCVCGGGGPAHMIPQRCEAINSQ